MDVEVNEGHGNGDVDYGYELKKDEECFEEGCNFKMSSTDTYFGRIRIEAVKWVCCCYPIILDIV